MVTINRLHVRHETDKQSALELAHKLSNDDLDWVYFAVMLESGKWSIMVYDENGHCLGYL